jgi:hypothetical protein
VVDVDAPLGQQLLDVAIRKPVAQVPADRDRDHLGREPNRRTPNGRRPGERLEVDPSGQPRPGTTATARARASATDPDLPGVSAAASVAGPYDVILRAEARTIDRLGRLVVSRIQSSRRAAHDHLSDHLSFGGLSPWLVTTASPQCSGATARCRRCAPADGAARSSARTRQPTPWILQQAVEVGDLHEWEMSNQERGFLVGLESRRQRASRPKRPLCTRSCSPLCRTTRPNPTTGRRDWAAGSSRSSGCCRRCQFTGSRRAGARTARSGRTTPAAAWPPRRQALLATQAKNVETGGYWRRRRSARDDPGHAGRSALGPSGGPAPVERRIDGPGADGYRRLLRRP